MHDFLAQHLTQYQLNFWERILEPAIVATFEMVIITTILASIFGFFIAIILLSTNVGGIRPNKVVYNICSFLVNTIRSFPFIILVVFLLPLTKLMVGTVIGVPAACVPLVFAASAFIAKLIENAMKEVDPDLIEAMRSFGITESQVIFRVMLSEALPAISSGIVLATISILGCTAMAGAVGAGGIGSIAINYGYQRFNVAVMVMTAVMLIVLVELIEVFGNWLYRKLK